MLKRDFQMSENKPQPKTFLGGFHKVQKSQGQDFDLDQPEINSDIYRTNSTHKNQLRNYKQSYLNHKREPFKLLINLAEPPQINHFSLKTELNRQPSAERAKPSPKALSVFQTFQKGRENQPRQNSHHTAQKEVTSFNIPKSYLELKRNSAATLYYPDIINAKSPEPEPIKVSKIGCQLYYVSEVIQAIKNNDKTELSSIIKDHIQQLIQEVKYALNQAISDQHRQKKIYLPMTNKKTILFDLDETLIHCYTQSGKASDVVLTINFPTGEEMEANINIRPYANYVLSNLAKHFELILFTASQSCYADKIIDYLDPDRNLFSHRFYREHCICLGEGIYVKDLRILGNRQLQNLLLVDNSAYSFAFQIDNGVPIIPYYNNKADEQLKHLQKYLLQFKNVKDVRTVNHQNLKVLNYGLYSDTIDLLTEEFPDYI